MIDGINLTTIYVGDSDAALDFCTNVLGMEKRRDKSFGDGNRWIEVASAGAQTCLVLSHGFGGWSTDSAGKSNSPGLTTPDIDETYNALVAQGVVFTMEPTRLPWDTNADFEDPDGNSFVLSDPA